MSQNLGDVVVIDVYYADEGGVFCYLNGDLFNPTSLHIIANERFIFEGEIGLNSDDDENRAYVIFEAPKIIIDMTTGEHSGYGYIFIKNNGYNKLTFNNSSVNFDKAEYDTDPDYIGPIAFTGDSSINITDNSNGKTLIKCSSITGTVTLDVDDDVQEGTTFSIEATDNQLVITNGEWEATSETVGNVTTYTLAKAGQSKKQRLFYTYDNGQRVLRFLRSGIE